MSGEGKEKEQNMFFLDETELFLGLEIASGFLTRLIQRNTVIPSMKCKIVLHT
eukprot:Gb_00291 [translate_table: standard]